MEEAVYSQAYKVPCYAGRRATVSYGAGTTPGFRSEKIGTLFCGRTIYGSFCRLWKVPNSLPEIQGRRLETIQNYICEQKKMTNWGLLI